MNEFTEQYTALSTYYDRLTFDVDYKGYADFAHRIFSKNKIPGRLILELACGTGSLSFEMAGLGYEMISSDLSPDMLSVAESKCAGLDCPPVFICQDMTELDLYGTVDGCICALDSINYLTELWQLKRVFKRVAMFLNRGGVFLFDVKSVGLFKEMSGSTSAWEQDELFAVWQYGYDSKSMHGAHSVDIFVNKGGLYQRCSEIHYQRAYTMAKLKELLDKSGLELLGIYRDMKMAYATNESGRLYFAAVKKQEEVK